MRLLLKHAKPCLLAVLLPWLCLAATAQSKISRVEYYFDADPGFGKATTVSITAADSVANTGIKVNPATLTAGLHTLYLRARTASGIWGQDVKWLFLKPYAAQPLYTLKQAEYYIDKDPGFGNATAVTITQADSAANTLININPSALSQGMHTLFVRARNTNGTWGQDVKWLFLKPYASKPLYALKQVEYYIDKDPGFGKGTAISITPGDSVANALANINVGGLTKGTHTLFMRSRNANGTWGHDVKWQFINSVLPLTLLSFTGETQHNTNILNWQTTQEINTQSFTVQRSGDGANFTAIGSVPAADAPGTNNYSLTDTKPLVGANYYRLKMIDKDGAFTYSGVVELNNSNTAFALQVYPNPAVSSATLNFNSLTASKYAVTITGSDGKTIKRIAGTAVTGTNTQQLDISGLAAGVYMVTFTSADGTHNLKLVKQ